MYPYPPPPPPQPMPMGQLEVELGFFPLMWILFLITPSVSINGYAEQRKWGRHLWNLPAGTYEVRAWYPYIFRRETSPGRLVVNVMPGHVTRLKYRPSWLTFLDGSMTFLGCVPAFAPPPQMYQLPPPR